MMQPIDPLSQLAMCCGLGTRKRELKTPRNFLYSPSHIAHLNRHESSWALANSYGPQLQPQPYLLLTQPVIITNNPGLNQTNHHTMTLVQHAQTAPNSAAGFPSFSMLGASASPQHPQLLQPNIISSQYAIYNSATGTIQPSGGPLQAHHQMATIQEVHENGSPMLANSQSIYSSPKAPARPMPSRTPIHQSNERKVATLSSEVFRQIEVIEKQVDLSADMETVERYGIVITRALDPYSLVPHLTETNLREYNEQYMRNDGYVVRFVEIIKRPGQTLGLYIRTIRFDDAQGRGSRAGIVITKIDTDSPVYNSPILHVGDEIISVNLVDVNGMSLDNVVVIMSIPRRLVLALRVPRGRLLSMEFMQQQQQQPLRNSVDQGAAATLATATAAGSAFVDRPPRTQTASLNDYQFQVENPQRAFDCQPASDIKQPVISNIRLGDTPEQSSYFSSSIDAINRELKELRRQRMALSNNEQSLDPTKVDF